MSQNREESDFQRQNPQLGNKNIIGNKGIRAHLFSSDEGSCYIVLTRNNSSVFYGVCLQSFPFTYYSTSVVVQFIANNYFVNHQKSFRANVKTNF